MADDPDAESYYFMGKDNIVFHAEIWPAMLLGYNGQGDKGGTPGPLGTLNLPSEVVSSEYLTMEGRKFSSSRGVVIYVRDFLERYDVDALRYYVAVAGPENQDTDFTWSEFVRRNNDELVATWGNLVNRSVSFAARNIGSIPEPGDADRRSTLSCWRTVPAGVRRGRRAPGPVPVQVRHQRGDADGGRGQQVLLRAGAVEAARERPGPDADVLHVALQLVDDAKTLLTPFLPRSSQQVHRDAGRRPATGPDMPRDRGGGRGRRPLLPGDHRPVRRRRPLGVAAGAAGHPAGPARRRCSPSWTPSVADEELARLGAG